MGERRETYVLSNLERTDKLPTFREMITYLILKNNNDLIVKINSNYDLLLILTCLTDS